jgi:tetratricopeptide (TPR) repeat protein
MAELPDPRALIDAALAAHRAGDLAAAADGYSQLLQCVPEQPDALHLLGLVRLSQGTVAEAEDLIRRALKRIPNIAEVWNSLGNAQAVQGKSAEAVQSFERALSLNPQLAGALVNLGRLASTRNDSTAAEDFWRKALVIDPNEAEAWTNLGVFLYWQSRWQESVEALERAQALRPHSPFVANNLGMAYRVVGRVEDAIACQHRALALDPNFTEAQLAAAVADLSLGRWRDGWREYLARPAPDDAALLFRDVLPQNLSGRSFLVRKNQGLGDEIFFLRFAAELRRRGASHIAYEADPRLASMLQRADLVDEIRTSGQRQDGETALSVADLPFVLGMKDGGQIPPTVCLMPDADSVDRNCARLAAAGPGPYLGLTWRAGTDGRMGIMRKEVPLAGFAAAIRDWPGTLVALQRQPFDGEISELSHLCGRSIADFTADNNSLEDMLAIVSMLESYVAVSNTNVHLRSAVELPTIVLVPRPPDWRWMESAERSPWFPDCPLFRQASDASWNSALDGLTAMLNKKKDH